MTRRILVSLLALAALQRPLRSQEAAPASLESQVEQQVRAPGITIVHFWAPWCSNCKSELADGKWSSFIAANSDVSFVFVTIWNSTDGHEVLERNGVGAEKNFSLLLHPNDARKGGDKLTQLMGIPVSWIPTTWIFKDGMLYYAMNYGELRFSMLQQLIKDSSDTWEH
jgi:thiol-disulfide isomerase/thioredoxin